jgi:predicted ATPase
MVVKNFEKMESIIKSVLLNAKCYDDKVQAYCSRVYALGSLGKLNESVDLALDVMRQLGEKFPRYPSPRHLLVESFRLKLTLRGETDSDILNLPPMTDHRRLACMKIGCLLLLTVYKCRPILNGLIVMRQVRNTLIRGSSVYTSIILAQYGMMLLAFIENLVEGSRFGALANEYFNRFGVQEYLPRVYVCIYGVALTWTIPLKDTLEFLKKGATVALQTGNVEFGAFCACIYLHHLSQSGVSIPEVLYKYNIFKQRLGPNHHSYAAEYFETDAVQLKILAGILPISVISDDMLASAGLKDGLFSMERKEVVLIRLCQMVTHFWFREYKEAAKLADFIIKNTVWFPYNSLLMNHVYFFIGMIAVQLVVQGSRKHRSMVWKCIKKLIKYTIHCPNTSAHYLYLLQA